MDGGVAVVSDRAVTIRTAVIKTKKFLKRSSAYGDVWFPSLQAAVMTGTLLPQVIHTRSVLAP
jgi:hypothetical protein